MIPHRQFVPKTWGQEEWLVNADGYCGKILRVYSGMRCSLHMHPIKDETFYVQDGIVELEIGEPGSHWPYPIMSDGVAADIKLNHITLTPSGLVRIPPLTWHRFGSRAGATIFEFSTRHDDADVVRAEESGAIPTDPHGIWDACRKAQEDKITPITPPRDRE